MLTQGQTKDFRPMRIGVKRKKKKKNPLNRHHIVLKIYIIFKIIVSKYIKMQSLSTKTKTKTKSFFLILGRLDFFFFG